VKFSQVCGRTRLAMASKISKKEDINTSSNVCRLVCGNGPLAIGLQASFCVGLRDRSRLNLPPCTN
jgi:hypothetical protein